MSKSADAARPAARARSRRWLPKIALAAASFLGIILIAEVVLSLAGFGNVEIYQPDPRLFWRLRPNQDCFTKVDHRPVHINAHGTRGGEFPLTKPPGTIRILSLGDSKTFGWGLSEAETYSALLEEGLRSALLGTDRIHVINAGVNAWSYPQMKVYLENDGLKFQPDFVLLADANLWTQFSEDSDPEFVQQMMNRVRLKNLLRRSAIYHFVIEVQLNNFYQRYRTRFIPVDPKQDEMFKEAQKSDPDAVFRNAIEAICERTLAAGAKPVVIFIPIQTDLEAGREIAVQRVKREVCQRLGVPFVDLTGDLKDNPARYYLEADPVHLNAEGNQRVARRLVEVFTPLLNPSRAPANNSASGSANP